MKNPLFTVYSMEHGHTFGDPEFWGDDVCLRHLEDHLLIGPTGRVFWYQHDGLKEITNKCALSFPAGSPINQSEGTHP